MGLADYMRFLAGYVMGEIIKLETPLSDDVVGSLRAGDEVVISGVLYTGRDMAHKRLCELIDAGKELPVELAGQVIQVKLMDIKDEYMIGTAS